MPTKAISKAAAGLAVEKYQDRGWTEAACIHPAFVALQVKTKLKLAAVDSIFLASSGERVTSLDQLQDIDELHVVEVRQASVVGGCMCPKNQPAQ